jgi:hypothetical protein
MDFRLILCIGMGAFVTYIGVVMLVTQFQRKPYVPPPKPNFTSRSTAVVDPKTGEKTIYREITVSTKFSPTPATPPPVPPHLESVPQTESEVTSNIQHPTSNTQ